MKLFTGISIWAAGAILASALTVGAQSEQWLRYRTSREGRSYHWLDLTTNAPAGVALPKLEGAAYYARWATPLDPSGGRWACFDHTRKGGPCDRVYFDTTGNGRLDDKPAMTANRREDYAAYFDPVKIVFKGEDGPITYHLVLRFMQYEANDVRLLASSGGWYEGQVTVAGKKRRIELVDGNVNGVFNDRTGEASECDRVIIDGEQAAERYQGKFLEVDGQLCRFEAARDGAFVKIQKAENIAFGTVRVPEAISEFSVFGENGHFVRKPAKGEFTLPVGQYRVHGWTIPRKDEKGGAWTLSGSDFGAAAEFEVTASGPAEIKVGEPISAVLGASQSGS
jgi:hypothetical protein